MMDLLEILDGFIKSTNPNRENMFWYSRISVEWHDMDKQNLDEEIIKTINDFKVSIWHVGKEEEIILFNQNRQRMKKLLIKLRKI